MSKFYVPPRNQGQIVEVAYASTPDGVLMRSRDASDGTTVCRMANWTRALRRWDDNGGAMNSPPPKARWKKLRTCPSLSGIRRR